jgi:hypothetical protein
MHSGITVGDTVYSVVGAGYPAWLDTIYYENVFGKKLQTFRFFINDYDYYTYTDSIGFNVLMANTFRNWDPRYLIGCSISGFDYGEIVTSVRFEQELNTCKNIINYPNPFSTKTTIKFYLERKTQVNLKIYNLLGKIVYDHWSNDCAYGYNRIELNGDIFPSGLFLYSVTCDSECNWGKFMVLR